MTDHLAHLKAEVGLRYLGSAAAGQRLRGGNRKQLEQDAERVAAEGGLNHQGAWPTPQMAVAATRRAARARLRRALRR